MRSSVAIFVVVSLLSLLTSWDSKHQLSTPLGEFKLVSKCGSSKVLTFLQAQFSQIKQALQLCVHGHKQAT